MICMVLNTILYMDGDVKKQDHRAAASKPTHKDQCVPWYLLPFNPISNVCIVHVNVYTLVFSYMKGHVDDHVLHVHVYILPTMLTELLYPLQDGYTPLHCAVKRGHTTYVERLLSTPGIDVNMKARVSWFIECCCISVNNTVCTRSI